MGQDCAILLWHMAATFAEKFEQALAERREREPEYGLRTLARTLADNDPDQMEIIRRRLHKYRPKKPGGGSAVKVVTPTDPTRHEIEDAMGLERDALAPERPSPEDVSAEAAFLADLAPLRKLFEISRQLERGELQVVKT